MGQRRDSGAINLHPRSNEVDRRARGLLIQRHLLIALGLTLLFTALEALLWVLNPFHRSGAYTLVSLFTLPGRIPVLLLVPLGELALTFWLTQRVAQPLALRAYLKAVYMDQERYRALYTHVANWGQPYDMPAVYIQDNPDPSLPRQQHTLRTSQLIEMTLDASCPHLLLLGAAGMGKSILIHSLLSATCLRTHSPGGRSRLPILFTLRDYAHTHEALDIPASADFSLLDFLATIDYPGLSHVRPYLGKLFQEGRLLFLCDGLEDLSAASRQAFDQEVALLFRQDRNALILTCTPAIYEQSSELFQLADENLVPRAILQPLTPADIRKVVERFISESEQDHSNRPALPTAGQIMSALERTRLQFLCTTPLYLFALLDVLGTVPVGETPELDTRGRLLEAFLLNRLQAVALDQEQELLSDELMLLGDLACVAHWNGDNDLLAIPGGGFLTVEPAKTARQLPIDLQADELMNWTREQQVALPFAQETVFTLAEMLEPEMIVTYLRRAQEAAMIEIDARGMLHFRHTLLASAALAGYLGRFLGTVELRIEAIETFPDDLALWSEPLTLWAGQLAQPVLAAAALATYAQNNPDQLVEALITSLICLGVAQTPPGVEQPQPLTLPDELAEVLTTVFQQGELWELSSLFNRCTLQGAPELYQALFPLLSIPGIDALLVLLDPIVVSQIFFQRLLTAIDDSNQEALVKRLVRALGNWGSVVVPRASELSSTSAGGRLRTAAINILGGTRERTAVEPLMECLLDPDRVIVGRAANALIRLGPNLTLPRLVQELEIRTPANRKQPLHWIILPILERFLNENNPSRQLTDEQAERIIAALLHVQSTHDVPADVEKVREMLVDNGRQAPERDSGKITINLLMQNLATSDIAVAQSMTGALKEVGEVATPQLLDQLNSTISEAERVRILEILASVRDLRALDALLDQLKYDELAVQQALNTALHIYSPECLPGLIQIVLYNPDEMIAARAEQALVHCGPSAVEPVIQALHPIVHARTQLLVHVLEHAQDQRAVPALLTLMESAQNEIPLALAIIQALGQCNDQRAVQPLLHELLNPNPLLSEAAINALSTLGELACPELLKGLDVREKTPLVGRIERVLLVMQPFPGELLLQTSEHGSTFQLAHIEEIFVARGADAAQVLATNLFHQRSSARDQVRQALDRMDGRYAVPALLEILNETIPEQQAVIAAYLLNHPREAIPPLVGLLGDPERGEPAAAILLQAGQPVLPALIPALDASPGNAQTRGRELLVALVGQQPELLDAVVELFGMALPTRAHETLEEILTEELAEISLPALLNGLEDAHLIPDVAETLARLALRNTRQRASVLEELLQALRIRSRSAGASQTLIDLGAVAVPGVGSLITDPDPQVARSARHILSEIGTPALPFIWAAHSDANDPIRREAAREVFRTIPTLAIKDTLVALLSSDQHEEISMALALLQERIHDEEQQPGNAGEMLPALLEHVQSSGEERASLRIMALLILLGGPMVAQALIDALYGNPQSHELLFQAFLLLGQGMEADLLAILRDDSAPTRLQAEASGILGIRVPHRDVREHALSLSKYGLWAGHVQKSTTVPHEEQLDIALRSLGGLLVAGHWDARELQGLRADTVTGSPEHEIYDILLGWRYSPQITLLKQDLETERQERNREMMAYTEELLAMKAQLINLEHDLETLQRQQHEQRIDHEQRRKEFEDEVTLLKKERQTFQSEARTLQREKQELTTLNQKTLQEKQTAEASLQQWKTYIQQLEQENATLRRPKSNA